MKCLNMAKQLRKIARTLTSGEMDDYDFVADQLSNADEISERKMISWLSKETEFDKSKLKNLVGKWYGDVSLKMKMMRYNTRQWRDWLKKELG